MLNRSQFNLACKALIDKHAASSPSNPATSALVDWSWNDKYPYGYISRRRYVRRLQYPSEDEYLGDEAEPALESSPDPATATSAVSQNEVISEQHVVFSATFQVPAIYFTVHDSNGTPLTLMEIMSTSLFKFRPPTESEATTFGLTLPNAQFPLLSQGDHPTLGTPCWFLHPCETNEAVGELIAELNDDDWIEETRLIRWMEMWFMTVGAVLDM